MAMSVAFVALRDDQPAVSASALADYISATWSSVPAPTNAKADGNTIAFRIGEADVVYGLMPEPMPWSDLEGPCSTSWLWSDAATAMKEHRSHSIVTVSSQGDAVQRTKVFTYATAAMLATCDSVGVFWYAASLVVSPELFCQFAAVMLPETLPLFVWLDLRVWQNEDGTSSGFTAGMSALGHMEFETEQCPESVGDLRERFVGLASYLLENGPVIENGDTVGEGKSERIRVVFANSIYGHEGEVMRLDYSTTPRK